MPEQIEIKKISGAETQSRTEIACSSDTCLDHLGYLGIKYYNNKVYFTIHTASVQANKLKN